MKIVSRIFNAVFPYGNWSWYIVMACFLFTLFIAQYFIMLLFGNWEAATTVGDTYPFPPTFPTDATTEIAMWFSCLGYATMIATWYFAITLIFDVWRFLFRYILYPIYKVIRYG